MYGNKNYNTRNSGRYNNAGSFIPGGEPTQSPGSAPPQPQRSQQRNAILQQHAAPQQQQQQQQQFSQMYSPVVQPPLPPTPPKPTTNNLQQVNLNNADVEMKTEPSDNAGTNKVEKTIQPWMKSKLQGVKKISNKERRRRQNETLRRLLSPKNALMVLNEMLPKEQVANQFKVEPAPMPFYSAAKQNNANFCADLKLEGASYKGYGENKLSARNAAAEQAIRAVIIKKMNKVLNADGAAAAEAEADEEALPMIQLASFALHKLFTEWECEGHKVPQLKPSAIAPGAEPDASGSAAAGAAAAAAAGARPRARSAKPLPLNAAQMHPCMLLTYMRSRAEYRELDAAGDAPQHMTFTVGVVVDGATYVGKASNKKEARKLAATSACAALFGVQFAEGAAANVPVTAAS